MAARENEIGRCKCPVCNSTSARLRVSAKQLSYVTCNTCNAQVFARSDRSDAALRALHIPEAAAPALPAPEAVPTHAATPAAPAPAITQPNKPAGARLGWGILV